MPTVKTRRWIRWLRWAGPVGCFALLALWGLSITHRMIYARPGTTWSFYVRIGGGQIGVFSQGRPFFPPPDYRWDFVRDSSDAPDWTWDVHVLSARDWTVLLPFWMPLGTFLAATVFAWWPWKQRRPGCCKRCGYDLTGNMSGICPECGRSVPSGANRPTGSRE